MIEETLVSLIKADTLLGSLINGRVYAMVMPQQGRLPCIVYQKISSTRVYSHDGDSELVNPRFQFSCWASSYAEAKAVAEALINLLSGYSDRPEIQAIFVDNEMDSREPETGLYRALVDFKVWRK